MARSNIQALLNIYSGNVEPDADIPESYDSTLRAIFPVLLEEAIAAIRQDLPLLHRLSHPIFGDNHGVTILLKGPAAVPETYKRIFQTDNDPSTASPFMFMHAKNQDETKLGNWSRFRLKNVADVLGNFEILSRYDSNSLDSVSLHINDHTKWYSFGPHDGHLGLLIDFRKDKVAISYARKEFERYGERLLLPHFRKPRRTDNVDITYDESDYL